MTKEIPLSRGMVAIVDDIDYEWLSQWKWQANPSKSTFYADRRPGTWPFRKVIKMHRIIINAPPGIECDHIDGNGLNNVRSNLRLATHSQNIQNTKRRIDGVSGYKGVTANGNNWKACIKIDGHQFYLGTFKTKEEAARVYDAKARELFGKFARPNFKEE